MIYVIHILFLCQIEIHIYCLFITINEICSTSKDEADLVDANFTKVSENTDHSNVDLTKYHQNDPLDSNADIGNTETIDQLKSWVTDCMERNRSPSPDFIIKSCEKITDDKETCAIQPEPQFAQTNESDKQTVTKKVYQQNYIPTLDEIKEGKYEEVNLSVLLLDTLIIMIL